MIFTESFDIIYSTMRKRTLAKLRSQIEAMRRSPQKAADLEALAAKLGRKKAKGRGKEPVWVSTAFPNLYPLAIPHHSGRDLAIGTKNNILNQLEEDIDAWDEKIRGEGDDDEESKDE